MLLIEKVKILAKYSNFSHVFSEEKTWILPELTKFNQYAIKLQDGKQSFDRSIYSLKLVEFEILKIYIETNLANDFF